jgi:hypothetical protein
MSFPAHLPNANMGRPEEQHMKDRRFFIAIFLVACVISIILIFKVFTEKSEYRLFYKGDIASELSTYIAGVNFERHGFAKLHFMWVYHYAESFEALRTKDFYTHYPPGPSLVSGVLQKLGVHDFYHQKASILFLNLAGMLVLTSVIRRMLPEEQEIAPFVLMSMAITSAWFVWWAGNLHQHAYNDLFMALGVWAVLSHKERLYLLVCFISLLFSFEPTPWLGVLGVFMATQQVVTRRWNLRQGLMFGAAIVGAFLLSLGLHVVQNAFFFHSLSEAIDDLRKAFQNRAGLVVADYPYSVVKHIAKDVYASLWFYGTGVLILAGIGLKTSVKRRLWLPVVILCAGLVWQFVFHYHSMLHGFMTRHFGIGLLVLATIGFLHMWKQTTWKKSLALFLLSAAILRLPLGCELSKNPFWLDQLRRVVAKTDSATIAELIYFFKDNPEHTAKKRILINELALRGRALPDQPAYTIVRNGKPLTMVRIEQGDSMRYANLPKDRTPVFHDSMFPYLDAAGPLRKVPEELRNEVKPYDMSTAARPTELVITGNYNKARYRLLLAGLLLQ